MAIELKQSSWEITYHDNFAVVWEHAFETMPDLIKAFAGLEAKGYALYVHFVSSVDNGSVFVYKKIEGK